MNEAEGRVTASRHLTMDEAGSNPVGWLPDGKTLMLLSDQDGTRALFRQDLNDETAQKIAIVPRGVQDAVLTRGWEMGFSLGRAAPMMMPPALGVTEG